MMFSSKLSVNFNNGNEAKIFGRNSRGIGKLVIMEESRYGFDKFMQALKDNAAELGF